MQALLALTRANIRSYTRDRAAVFWTLAFPLVFIVLFGLIFQGSGTTRLTIGWVDADKSAAAQQHEGLRGPGWGDPGATTRGRRMSQMEDRQGRLSSSCRGYGAALGPRPGRAGAPAQLQVYTDPSRPQLQGVGLPGGRERSRGRQPRRPAAAGRPRARRRSRPRT